MFSLKPGRGKSFGDFLLSLTTIAFGVIWTAIAYEKSESDLFPLFGIIFVIVGIGHALVHFYNAFGKNRFSIMDATNDGEEPDPFATMTGKEPNLKNTEPRQIEGDFCPFCGISVKSHYDYCPGCGKDI